jgi:2Fe-2S ferredoxin
VEPQLRAAVSCFQASGSAGCVLDFQDRNPVHPDFQCAFPGCPEPQRYNCLVPKVVFLPMNAVAEFEPATLPYQGHGKPGSLLDVALNFGVPLGHTCGGNCACTTCHVIVREGEEHLSEMEDLEGDRLYSAAGLTLHSRLACQAVVSGNVVVEVVGE